MVNGNMENVILNKNLKDININEVEIVPCNRTVVLSFYEKNPYRHIEVVENGLILGIESTKRYKSNETGEMEDAEEYIACAKVIAVGPDCRNVNVGDDVFCVKHVGNPIPFRNKGYRAIDEQNIICRIINKE